MATPDIILFSPLKYPIAAAIEKLKPVFEANEAVLAKVSRLGWDPEEEQFQCIGNDIMCSDENEALRIASKWEGFVLSYDVGAVFQRIYLNSWSDQHRSFLSIQITPQVLTFESDEFPEGKWLQKFILTVTADLEAEVSGYGSCYDSFLSSLDPIMVVARLRDGELQKVGFPSLHMLTLPLISSAEIRSILHPEGTNSGLNYFVTTTGYHVLSNLPCD